MTKKNKSISDQPKKTTLYTIELTDDQMKQLDKWCAKQLWVPYDLAYARFAYKGTKVNVVAYESGKLVVQGTGTGEFVTFTLEGEITKTPLLGYDDVIHPEWFELHAGLDESGKGDFFGPLVTACVIADKPIIDKWVAHGLKESKKVTSDDAILRLEKIIRDTKGVVVRTTFAGMAKYNQLYEKFGKNLNNLLAWMHSRSLSEALKVRRAPWGMLDQFSKRNITLNYFKDNSFDLRMQTKAEEDPVVAAASIIARATYIKQMEKLSQIFGEPLRKGASKKVKDQAVKIVKLHGKEALEDFAKLHFKTTQESLS